MQIGELFQQIAIGSLILLNPAVDRGQFALTDLNVAFCLVALLDERLFFRFQLGDRFGLFARVLLPFLFDLFYSLFDLGNSNRYLLLLLLQFFEGHDFIAQLGKIRGLSRAFAAQADFALLQKALFMTKRYASSLAPDFQSDLAKACPDKTHG